jgi:ABC-2 type transport system ATP-binding protein
MWLFCVGRSVKLKMSFIEVKQISKTFRVAKKRSGLKASIKSFFKREYMDVKAVDEISFSIDKGEIVGYIGPNGAGKSTTIKILSGILVPDSGKCKIKGMIPWKNRKEYVKNIGVVFGQRSQLWWDIPAEDTFDLLRDIYEIPEEEFQTTKEDLIKRLNLSDIINIPVRQLSLGQRMRCEIAASLLHNPEILFLDEPTIGLDAVSKQVVRDFIKKLNKEKKTTIILTSHDMSDITALAKRIILIGKGRVLYDGSLKILQNHYETQKYVSLKTKDTLKIHNKGIIQKTKNKDGYDLVIDTSILSVTKLLNLISEKITIEDIEIDHENIDNIIVKLYEDYKI